MARFVWVLEKKNSPGLPPDWPACTFVSASWAQDNKDPDEVVVRYLVTFQREGEDS